MLCTVN